MREGRAKKTGKLLTALLLRAEARGLFLRPSRGPATRTRTRGLGKRDKHPSFQIKRMREGRTKKTGKLLIALLLRAEARGLFLRPSQGPATRTRTQGLDKRNKTPPLNREKAPGGINPLLQGLGGYTRAGALVRTHQSLDYETPSL